MHRRSIFLATLLGAAACALAACDRGPRPSDPAKPIRARVGREFRISVENSPSARRTWYRVDPAGPAPLVLVDSAVWMRTPVTLGGRGVKSWTFLARHAGSTTVSLVSIPPGQERAEVPDTLRYRVVIE
jgi:hypothetical protein